MANAQTITINIKAISDMSDVLGNVKQVQNALGQLKLPVNLENSFKKSFGDIEKEVAKVQAIINKPVKSKSDVTGLEKGITKINTLLYQLQNNMGKINPKILQDSLTIDPSKIEAATKKVNDLKAAIEAATKTQANKGGLDQLRQFYEAWEKAGSGKSNAAKDFMKFIDLGQLDKALEKLKSLESFLNGKKTREQTLLGDKNANPAELSNIQKQIEAYDKLVIAMRKVYESASGGTLGKLNSELQQAETEADNLANVELQALLQAFSKLSGEDFTNLINQFNSAGGAVQDLTRNQAQFNSELDQVKSRIQYFFGLTNAINLVKRAVRGAFDTIKELDKAMTETAVVTNYTVGDMWKALPRYTKVANDLGVTTKGAYETMTLFYQQGLNTDQAFALGTETMKMARIAGLDYKDATDAMTSALRGFNMELNETSAQRVNDVYSQLAAISASNVEEISTAMTKTASLAHNAGMEFETTSAFLSQIIETTREAPETAGTALKTVIARFTELKKPIEEIGEVEGEVVDANKIETALRSIGVALRDQKGEFRDLDDVFLDISKKWDSLSTNQQRYVATMAAGSRQQSRFIAMMSDYGRTQELINEAYDSAGASQQQYEKTLDSLESKLNKLKNAWDQFLMGLTNSNIIKGAVDGLTWFLNTINKLTGALGENIGSLAKWALVIKTIKIGRGLFGKGSTGGLLGNIISTAGWGVGEGSKASLLGGFGNLGKAAIGKAGSGRLGAFFASKIPGLGAAAPGIAALGTGLVAVTAAAGLAYLAIKKIYDASPQGQLKALQKTAEKLNEIALDAEKTSSSMKDVQSSIGDYNEAVSMATTLEERDTAIQNRNDYITSLLEQDKAYAEYLNSTFEGGELILTLDSDALAAACDEAAKAAIEARTTANVGDAAALLKDASIILDALNNNYVPVETTENQQERGISGKNVNDYIAQTLALYYNLKPLRKESEDEYYLRLGEALNDESIVEDLVSSSFVQFGETITQEQIKQIQKGWLEGTRGFAAEDTKLVNEAQQKNTQASNYIQTAIASLAPIADLGENAELITSGLQSLAPQFAQALAKNPDLFGEDYKDFPAQMLDLMSTLNVDEYKSTLDFLSGTSELLNQNLLKGSNLQNALDFELVLPTELKELIEASGKTIKEVQQQQVEAARAVQIEQLRTSGQQLGSNWGLNYEKLAQFYLIDNPEIQQFITDLSAKIQDAKVGQTIFDSIFENLNTFEDSELQTWINGLDFSNPITAAKYLQDAINGDNQAIKQLATDINDVDSVSKQLSSSSQVIYALTSQSFTDLNEDVDDFIKKNGKITSDNVEELAKSSSELDAILKNGTVSAESLANILTQMSTGEFSVLNLNDALLAAVNSMHSLDQMAEETINDLNSFDPGYDEADVTGFISKAYDSVNKALEEGHYGSNQARNYIEKIFGDQAFASLEGLPVEEYGDAYINLMQGYNAILAANKENMYDLWSKIAATSDTDIFSEEAGEIVADIGNRTTDELVQYIQDQGYRVNGTPISEELARMLVTDLKYNSADLAYELSQNDIPAAIKAWKQQIEDEGREWYTADEAEQLSRLLGLPSVEALDDYVSNWSDGLKKLEITSESSGADIADALKTSGIPELDLSTITTDNLVESYNKLKDILDSIGLGFKTDEVFDALATENGIGGDWEGRSASEQAHWEEQNSLQATANDTLNQILAVISKIAGETPPKNTSDKIPTSYDEDENAKVWSEKAHIDAYNHKGLSDEQLVTIAEDEAEKAAAAAVMAAEAAQGEVWTARDKAIQDSITANQLNDFYTDIKKNTDAAFAESQRDNGEQDLREAGQQLNTASESLVQAVETFNAYNNFSGDVQQDYSLYGPSGMKDDSYWKQYSGGNAKSTLEPTPVPAPDTSEMQKEVADGTESGITEGSESGFSMMSAQGSKTAEQIATEIKEKIEKGEIDAAEAAQLILTECANNGVEAADVVGILQGKFTTAGDTGGMQMANRIASILATQRFNINITPTLTTPLSALLGRFTSARAKGGLVHAYGSGSNRIAPGPALTGEEGPEIVWNKKQGYAYVTGESHPEIQNLQPGDRVFNAQETKKILGSHAKGGEIPSLARGYGGSKKNSGSSSSSGSSSKSSGGGSGSSSSSSSDDETWKNEIDWLYNLVEDIDELEREQTKYQEKYDDLLKDLGTSTKDVANVVSNQLENLNAQVEQNNFLLSKREQEMREFMGDNSEFQDYFWYNWEDRTLEIDWDKIDAITDKEFGDKLNDALNEAEEIQDKMDSAEDAVQKAKNAIEDLEKQIEDDYIDFEQRVMEAYVQSFQDVIDDLTDLSEDVSNANSEILSALQSEISLQRQIRDNTKTEADISDKESRLAFLRRDTTSGNQAEILALEKELSDNRESYGDTLIDQAISKLQENNDEAAQQREHQIEIMQAQLDLQQQNGELWNDVHDIIIGAVDAEGHLLSDSTLEQLLKSNDSWQSLSDAQKAQWKESFSEDYMKASVYLSEVNGKTFNKSLTDSIGSYSQAVEKAIASSGSGGSGGGGGGSGGGGGGYADGYYGDYSVGKDASATKTATASDKSVRDQDTIKAEQRSQKYIRSYKYAQYSSTQHQYQPLYNDGSKGSWGYQAHSFNSNGYCYKCGYQKKWHYDGQTFYSKSGVQSYINQHYGNRTAAWKKAQLSKATYYKTGGLASFTGPAWLDGTPSEPEYVLNARQTDAFLKLADVLPNMMQNRTSNSNVFGGINLNLVMNVDEIGSDYDVDRIADRVKDIIYNASSYRNVNTLNFMR